MTDTSPLRPASAKRVSAVLGPTNTGKTHYAVERMAGHETGMIGLPLRLLAREIYDRVVEMKGAPHVALITGEEKIVPESARYFVCTVESMPTDREVDFLAIDEVQLCADPERGYIFTDRILHCRGTHETLLLGAETVRGLIRHLLGEEVKFITRTRFSELSYAGPRKISRLPRRSAVVAFSTDAVYSIAELIRRQRGGAAVVMGALSPRTRNAQVALYQSGEVDFLVATDAIGMGLNMDVDHVAFASLQKFDGRTMRALRPAEVAQIAGRAGRYTTDGTFGPTGEASAFEPDLVEQIESHRFDPVRSAQWRNRELDFSTLATLMESLDTPAPDKLLLRARAATDLLALQRLATEAEVIDATAGEDGVRRLWEVCQIPDFRNISPEEHNQLLQSVHATLIQNDGKLPEDYLAGHMARVDNTEGDIDALATRIAHIRTWTFVANKSHWLEDADGWQERTRELEDKLSDALHTALTQRFIDRRTSVLMKRLNQDEDLSAEINAEGEVTIENEFVGRLHGFRFVPDPRARGLDAKAVRRAADKAVRAMMAARAETLIRVPDTAIHLTDHGRLWWEGHPVGRLTKGLDTLSPRALVIADDLLDANYRDQLTARFEKWILDHINRVLTPLVALKDAATAKPAATEPAPEPAAEAAPTETPSPEAPAKSKSEPAPKQQGYRPNDPRGAKPGVAPVVGGTIALTGLARGIGYQIVETFGVLDRRVHAKDIKALEQSDRAQLRRFGLRFGEFSLFIPSMLKPSSAELLAILWGVHHERYSDEAHPNSAAPTPPAPGLTSVMRDPSLANDFYSAAGFRVCGPRAVRIDMLERLGGMIREARTPAKDLPKPKEAAVPSVKVEIKKKHSKIKSDDSAKAPRPKETEKSPADVPAKSVEVVATKDAAPAGAHVEAAKIKLPAGMFEASVDMMSIVGCSGEEFEGILRSLGYHPHTHKVSGQDDMRVWRLPPRHDGRRPQRGKPDVRKETEKKAKGARPHGKGKGGPQRSGTKPAPQPRHHRPRREKPLDPDSPFAVLAALKNDLKS